MTKNKLTPWERVALARKADRPKALDYINLIFTDFMELHGDRLFADDKSIIGGIGLLNEIPVTVIGQQKGKTTSENIERNFGMTNPEGYRKALRLMKQAEKFNRPIITFIDTPGAYPGLGAEERGQGEAIAVNLLEMSRLKVPIIGIIIGEGSSGGALALGVGDKIVMLENVRYFDLDGKKESNNDEELSKFYASLADVYINDAFGVSHRRAASTTGVSKYLESAVGFLVEEEINKLSILLNNPEKPFCIILGGAKVSDKIGIISNLIEKVDNIIIVGAMAFTFLKAKGINVGKSLIDEENIEYSKNLLDKYSDKIILPIDVYVSDKIDSNDKVLKNINEIGNDDIAFDIGPKTIENIDNILKLTKTVFLNGPAGAFEYDNFSYGTKEVLKSLKNSSAKVIIGGGDSASAAIKFGYKNSFYHISTGGGASLEFLSGKDMPGFENIGE